MGRRIWPTALACALVALVVGLIGGWAVGRGTAPERSPSAAPPRAQTPSVRLIDGIPIGVERSRQGALLASDNYVAGVVETVVQHPERYEKLVQAVFMPSAQPAILAEGTESRERQAELVADYAEGATGLAAVGARRLDSYDGTTATTTTWTAGFNWGRPGRPTYQRWLLVETSLRWDGQRWRVADMDQTERPAPSPAVIGRAGADAETSTTFTRELRGMSAPIYGGD